MNWAYGGESDEAESFRAIHRALELGMILLDTADVYGAYTNEDLVGRALRGHRDHAVVATKVGLIVGPNGGYPLPNDARPEHIREAIDASLARLRIDVIDLYQLHRIDPKVPLEESWGTMAELVAAGKVRTLGLRRRASTRCGVLWRSIPSRACSQSSRSGRATIWPRSSPGAGNTE